jgi:hypothetical protein
MSAAITCSPVAWSVISPIIAAGHERPVTSE